MERRRVCAGRLSVRRQSGCRAVAAIREGVGSLTSHSLPGSLQSAEGGTGNGWAKVG